MKRVTLTFKTETDALEFLEAVAENKGGKSGQIVEIVGLMALDAESVTGDLNIE